jgi:hypothetical protein
MQKCRRLAAHTTALPLDFAFTRFSLKWIQSSEVGSEKFLALSKPVMLQCSAIKQVYQEARELATTYLGDSHDSDLPSQHPLS